MTDLKDLELRPLDLMEIPEVLQDFIYPEETERGSVFCTKTAYMVVLLLRWALSGPEYGPEEYHEGRKVFWKTQDKYGFSTKIFLFSDKVEQFDPFEGDDGDMVVIQEQTWVELGELLCGNGRGIIEHVVIKNHHPFGEMKLEGNFGVTQLIVNAITSSHHTGYGTTWGPDAKRIYSRREDDYRWRRLSFQVQTENCYGSTRNVTSIDVEGGWEDLA